MIFFSVASTCTYYFNVSLFFYFHFVVLDFTVFTLISVKGTMSNKCIIYHCINKFVKETKLPIQTQVHSKDAVQRSQ